MSQPQDNSERHSPPIGGITLADVNPVDHETARIMLSDDEEYRRRHGLDDDQAPTLPIPFHTYNLVAGNGPESEQSRQSRIHNPEREVIARDLLEAVYANAERPKTPPNAVYHPPYASPSNTTQAPVSSADHDHVDQENPRPPSQQHQHQHQQHRNRSSRTPNIPAITVTAPTPTPTGGTAPTTTSTPSSAPPDPASAAAAAPASISISPALLHTYTRALAHPPPSAYRKQSHATGARRGDITRAWLAATWPAEFRQRHTTLREAGWPPHHGGTGTGTGAGTGGSGGRRGSLMRLLGPRALNVTDAYWAFLTERGAASPAREVGARQRVRCDEMVPAPVLLLPPPPPGGLGVVGRQQQGQRHASEEENDRAVRCAEPGGHEEWEFWICRACSERQEERLGEAARGVLRGLREGGAAAVAVAACEGCAEAAVKAYGTGCNGCLCDAGVRCLEHRERRLEALGRRVDAFVEAHRGPFTAAAGGEDGGQMAYCVCGNRPVRRDAATVFFCAGCENFVTLPTQADPTWHFGGNKVKPWLATLIEKRRLEAAARGTQY